MLYLYTMDAVVAKVTTTTASTGVADAPPQVPRQQMYDNWGVLELVFGILTLVIALTGGLLGIVEHFRKRAKERLEEEKSRDAPLENRVTVLEEKSARFRTTDDLDKEYGRLEEEMAHMKNNLTMSVQGVSDRVTRLSEIVGDEQRSRAKLEMQVEGIAANTRRVETSIDRLGERFDERFDRLTEHLSKKS